MHSLSIAFFMVMLIGCTSHNAHVKERADYWKSDLDTNIPAGTTSAKAIEWGISKNIKFDYLPSKNWLYSNVERVPDSGIGFPCSEWNIMLKVILDANGYAVKNEVSAVGSCI